MTRATPNFQIRSCNQHDLESILNIQQACYTPALNESSAIWFQRLKDASEYIWIAELSDKVCAYLACYPSRQGKIAPLDSAFQACRDADCLYFHDLAVSPEFAGQQIGRKLVEYALEMAKRHNFRHAALVCVQNARSFWQGCGFCEENQMTPAATEALASYLGQSARYMTKTC